LKDEFNQLKNKLKYEQEINKKT